MVILGFDIGAALVPDVSLLGIVVRGAVTYFAIFIVLRLHSGRRPLARITV